MMIKKINENLCDYTNVSSDKFDFEDLKLHFKNDIERINQENKNLS